MEVAASFGELNSCKFNYLILSSTFLDRPSETLQLRQQQMGEIPESGKFPVPGL